MAKELKLDISLNEKDLNRAIDLFEIDVAGKINAFVSALVQEGINYAKQEAPVDSGDLRQSIGGEAIREGATINGVVYATSGHAAFVEFGTGIVGEGTYPININDYEYNMKSIYKDESGGWSWGSTYTHGYEANPFMYRTIRHLTNVATQIAEGMPNDYK